MYVMHEQPMFGTGVTECWLIQAASLCPGGLDGVSLRQFSLYVKTG